MKNLIYRQQPAKRQSQNIEGEVTIPVTQALVTSGAWGVFASIVAGVIVYGTSLPWWLPALVLVMVLAGVFAISTSRLLSERRSLLWKVEEFAERDIDGDGVIGKPRYQKEREEPPLVYVSDPNRELRRAEAGDFRFFLRESYSGRGTTWGAWEKIKLPSGRKVTRPRWERYTKRLMDAGLAVREYATAPLTLVGSYKDALGSFREMM